MLHKDLALDRLASMGNVAQFVAFRPAADGRLHLSTSRVAGCEANRAFDSVVQAVETLLETSGESAVNIRSYLPEDPRSREFVYRISSSAEVLAHLDRLAVQGLHLIVNETIDVEDGGVSGVAQGGVIEFAPDDTPRAVEKPGVASLPRRLGLDLLSQVYGFAVELPGEEADRVEFSLHPQPRGWRQTQVLLWEIETNAGARDAQVPSWPNRFSRHIGDKVFGLLMAQAYGLRVPRTFVIPRRIAPFTFGTPTGSGEIWTRTCPKEPRPGLYTTVRGWTDPFRLLQHEDAQGEIASVLAQSNVPATFSGAAITGSNGLIVEGRAGAGDALMLGITLPQVIPDTIRQEVEDTYKEIAAQLGPVRIEWVHDGTQVWIVQLHVGATTSGEGWLTRGQAEYWTNFDVSAGLAALRSFVNELSPGTGLVLDGDVGLTSHLADVVRKWGGPARIRRPM